MYDIHVCMPDIYVCVCLYVSLQADSGDQQHIVLLSGPTLLKNYTKAAGIAILSHLFMLKVLTCTNTHTHKHIFSNTGSHLTQTGCQFVVTEACLQRTVVKRTTLYASLWRTVSQFFSEDSWVWSCLENHAAAQEADSKQVPRRSWQSLPLTAAALPHHILWRKL